MSSNTPVEEDDKEEKKKTTQATQLVALLGALPSYQLALTPDGELWHKAGNGSWLRIGSPAFESYALALWISVHKNVPAKKVATDAKITLASSRRVGRRLNNRAPA